MTFNKSFQQKLFLKSSDSFDQYALALFRHQAINNAVYSQYLNTLNINIDQVQSIGSIPFLPISFFKNFEVKTGEWQPEQIFESSGTTGMTTSKHHVRNLDFYKSHSLRIFEYFYGNPAHYHFMALLPSYLERNNSSLVFMVNELIEASNSPYSAFYLNNTDQMLEDIERAKKNNKQIFIIGVSFALLDLAEKVNINLKDAIILETGGMKGRRKELIREELHTLLSAAFNNNSIHTEYGMTELMSQAYAKENGIFYTDGHMKVLLRDLNDPFDLTPKNRHGGINIIDLANFETCAFLETQDIGRFVKGGFEVLGRFDNAEVRGCNLMI